MHKVPEWNAEPTSLCSAVPWDNPGRHVCHPRVNITHKNTNFQRQKQVFIGGPSTLTAYITLQPKNNKKERKKELSSPHTYTHPRPTCIDPCWVHFGPSNRLIENWQRGKEFNNVWWPFIYKTFSMERSGQEKKQNKNTRHGIGVSEE